jgi:hypothetical protein
MPTVPWGLWFFERTDSHGQASVPGVLFLESCPDRVVQKFDAILHSVIEAPPPAFAGGGQWEAMHGQMKGIYEARAKGPDARFYRLFCLLERELPGHPGLGLVVLTGKSKPRGTALSGAEYRSVVRLKDEFCADLPRRLTRG